ncbi:MAG: hypothetical protein ACI9SP_003335 [Arenicella sp.]|jgi:hypothetical protein
MKDTIVRAAIHPAIGIARVGNSKTEFYIGPEVINPAAQDPGFYRDDTGALKREAALFRVYGYNAQGEVVRELSCADADIEWQVHLANQKASWYEFQLALDIPEAVAAPDTALRNANIKGNDRKKLLIDGGKISISGADRSGAKYRFDKGHFFDKPVYLGELQTQAGGQLLVLGGHGHSASVDDKRATTFANNNGWHDDTSDGPVTATVSIDGQELIVEPAWVVVAPPNYGPLQKSVRTMYDLITDVQTQSGLLDQPETVSFSKDIMPLFLRMSNLEWVNKGYATQFGWGGPQYFQSEALLAQLGDGSELFKELRQQTANMFREFKRDGKAPQPWPWLYGDAMSVPPADTPRQHATVTDTQLALLQRWAEGDFISDYDPSSQPPRELCDVPLQEQPRMLDQAALEFCLADAFHPGCEMTWPMRHASMYMSEYRIRHRRSSQALPNYGSLLTPDVAVSEQGPLYAQSAGDITRWMAVPWQTDTASCKFGYYAGYGPKYDPYLPTFWPARVPNQVLTESDYDLVMDESAPKQQRTQAFNRRDDWFRTLGDGGYVDQINNMIHHFDKMGVVETRKGPSDGLFPTTLQVEHRDLDAIATNETFKAKPAGFTATGKDKAEEDITAIDKYKRFPKGL